MPTVGPPGQVYLYTQVYAHGRGGVFKTVYFRNSIIFPGGGEQPLFFFCATCIFGLGKAKCQGTTACLPKSS